MPEDKKKKPLVSRPKDRSLEAYKAWINEMTTAITGKGDDGSMTEEKWKDHHARFWKKADAKK